jgi:CubicO group peptidase (beta-lactamase class C family)
MFFDCSTRIIILFKYSLIFFISIQILSSISYSQEIKSSNERNILSLIEKFSDKDPFQSGEAIIEVVKYGNQAVNYLTKSLSDENDSVRWCSAIALGKIAPEGVNAVPFLTKALVDKNTDVRWCSAIALGKFEGKAKSSILELYNLLNDDDHDVRWAAYVSLSKIDKEVINKAPEFSNVVDKLEELTPQLMGELNVPGVSISVIKNYKLGWSESFGISDAIQQTQVNSKTIFEACSMSKPVFAYLVLKLVEQDKLDLDKPLSGYLREQFVCDDENYSKQITARMILTHTSGMPNWRKGGEEREGPLPVYHKPGTRFNYSGEGFYYLQRVIEHITKEPLETYIKRNLFDKLGFESTSFVWNENLDPQIATGHDTSGNCNERKRYNYANAAYTLYTTSDEYAKIIIEIMKPDRSEDQSLSDKMLKEMLAHQVRVDVRDVIDRPGRSLGLFSYRGLGWGIDSTITGDIVYHSGANQTGFRCYSQFNMREGSGIVIMTNGENGSELWRRLISEIGDL